MYCFLIANDSWELSKISLMVSFCYFELQDSPISLTYSFFLRVLDFIGFRTDFDLILFTFFTCFFTLNFGCYGLKPLK